MSQMKNNQSYYMMIKSNNMRAVVFSYFIKESGYVAK
jgi:hypothetical protein